MYRIHLAAQVLEGLQDAESGRLLTTEELLERVGQWAEYGGLKRQAQIFSRFSSISPKIRGSMKWILKPSVFSTLHWDDQSSKGRDKCPRGICSACPLIRQRASWSLPPHCRKPILTFASEAPRAAPPSAVALLRRTGARAIFTSSAEPAEADPPSPRLRWIPFSHSSPPFRTGLSAKAGNRTALRQLVTL